MTDQYRSFVYIRKTNNHAASVSFLKVKMKMHRFERRLSTERRSRGLWEAPPAGIVLGTNETDFMGSFTMSPFR